MPKLSDMMTIFEENTKIVFILLVFALMFAVFYVFIEPTIDALMGSLGY